ncbi:DNA-directed RNA polymerase II core subunit [Microbotryomycetes sp. JL201]|nr:DNA-directed RNA polymerase II core subunit [Microbotryomycetes sp. JL201]
MNAPNRAEQFILGDGEQKLIIDEDTKIPNAATITINKEDHTLANMLRGQLLLMNSVIFAGYKVPHPLEPAVVLKVQTDGTESPVEVVRNACKQLIYTLSKMKAAFTSEVARQQVAQDEFGGGGAAIGGHAGSGFASGTGGGYGGMGQYDAGPGGSQWY